MRVCIVTLGCPKNEVDSDRMAAAVRASAYELVDDPGDADAVVINTCAFIREAAEESVEAALDLAAEWKAARADRLLLVAGCLPSRYGSELADAMPEADAFVPVADEAGLLEILESLSGQAAEASEGAARASVGPSVYLMVSDGCYRRCSYCTIPAIRGPYRSRPLAELLDEARTLAALGAREIVLVGQDISSWGRDLPGSETLADLVARLAELDGYDWLRLMYVQPDGVTDALLETMAASPRVCRYLDLPLQHASRRVLERMHRTGDASSYLDLVGHLRGAMPDVVLRTSLIAGFPGETEDDLVELETFLEEASFDYAGVFAFSPEEGTPAAAMRPRVPAKRRLERANRIRETADLIGLAKAAKRVGETLEVLVEGVDDEGVTVGRWRGQAPEVDGVVSLDTHEPPGAVVRARIVDSLGYDLLGEVQA